MKQYNKKIAFMEEQMKLDHFIINIDEKYQQDKNVIEYIRNNKFPYEPKMGKGTKGFKVSDLWIGNEYLEMVHVLESNGGGWVKDWTEKYIQGHRGMICLMLDVEDIDSMHQKLTAKNIKTTTPEWLEFKWFFNLFTRRMPWRNSYVPFFEGVPFQIGFQEMKDDKSKEYMSQYMVPNSRQNGINGIERVIIKGQYTENDFHTILMIFEDMAYKEKDSVTIKLHNDQSIEFVLNDTYQIELYTNLNTGNCLEIENIKIIC